MSERIEIFPWNSAFETGIAILDQQHRRLVDLLNDLVSHIAFESDAPTVNAVFDALTEYAAVHFTTEEAVWSQHFTGDSWMLRHQGEHGDFVEKIGKLVAEKDARPLENMLEEIAAFLTHWLALHIIESDKRMAKAVLALAPGISLEQAKAIANEQMQGAARTLTDTVMGMMGMYDQLAQRTIRLTREIQRRTKAEQELRAAEANMAALRDAAVSANEAKSRFLANMSHEIRTPLNGMIGMSEILADENLPSQIAESVAMIRDSAVHLLGLIDNILDFSKIEAGRLEIVPGELSLRELASGVFQTTRPQADAKAVTMHLSVAPDVPDQLWSDPVRGRQILMNIVGNAVKFCAHQVELRIAVAQTTPLVLCIEVIDDGVGMSAETQSRIFAPFVQGESSTTRRFGGTGLGLAITKHLLDMLGGAITVRSAPGQGATFTILLPVEAGSDQARPNPMPDHAASPATRPPSPPGSAPARGAMVLVAEDDDFNRKVIGRQLHRLGYTCDLARDGREAFEMFQAGEYGLLITDLLMPEMDGYQLAESVRRSGDKGRRIPIIVLSANAGQGEADRASEHGVDRYLVKPILLTELQTVMRHFLPQG